MTLENCPGSRLARHRRGRRLLPLWRPRLLVACH